MVLSFFFILYLCLQLPITTITNEVDFPHILFNNQIGI